MLSHCNKPEELASVREFLQNSTDAGTSKFQITAVKSLPLVDSVADDLKLSDNNHPFYIKVEDNGQWHKPDDGKSTWDIVTRFFLRMNGSTKDDSKDNDGGFGVGRFAAVFCAPMWFFTAANVVVSGSYSFFSVNCRRCLQQLEGSVCTKCNLQEKDCPQGTTFLVRYDHFTSEVVLDRFLERVEQHLLVYTRLNYPVTLINRQGESKQLQTVSSKKVIYRKKDAFVVHKLDKEQDTSWPTYVVITHRGVPMFSQNVYGSDSEKGIYLVQLHKGATYEDFNQSRSDLTGNLKHLFSAFVQERNAESNSHDVDQNKIFQIQGFLDPVQSTATQAEEVKGPLIAAPLGTVQSQNQVDARMDVDEVSKDTIQGNMNCKVFLMDGWTFDKPDLDKNQKQVPLKFRPKSFRGKEFYIFLVWTAAIRRARQLLDSTVPFSIGVIYSDDTMAMRTEDNTYYINIMALSKQTDYTKRSNRFMVISQLLGKAIHEVTHCFVSGHNEAFASMMTEAVSKSYHLELSRNEGSLMAQECALWRKAQQWQRQVIEENKTKAKSSNKTVKKRKKDSKTSALDLVSETESEDEEASDDETERDSFSVGGKRQRD